jgi:hypothetical protein
VVPTNRSRRLASGALATLTADPFNAGALILAINGVTQSHVAIDDPGLLFFDYMRRMGNIIDAAAPVREPVTIVHLGGGGLSLPRYVAASRPASRQFVVEAEQGLTEFVLEAAPLPGGTAVEFVIADALDGLRSLAPKLAGAASVVVCDVYAGLSTPEHLRTSAFYAEVRDSVLAADGIIIVNVADEADLEGTRGQLSALGSALPHVVVVGPHGLLSGQEAGNAVLLASPTTGFLEWLPGVLAAGPHPAAARTRAEIGPSPARRDSAG